MGLLLQLDLTCCIAALHYFKGHFFTFHCVLYLSNKAEGTNH